MGGGVYLHVFVRCKMNLFDTSLIQSFLQVLCDESIEILLPSYGSAQLGSIVLPA